MEALGSVAVVLVIYLGWPVSLWLGGALVLALIFHGLTGPRWYGDIALELHEVALWIAVGLSAVTLAQITLYVFSLWVRGSDVLAWEESVVAAQQALASALGLSVLIPVLMVMLAASLLFPGVVRRFTAVRKHGKHAFLVLTAMASFSFFSGPAMAVNERQWVAERRTELSGAIEQVDAKRKEAVALAWIDRGMAQVAPSQVQKIDSALRRNWDEWTRNRIADRIARTVPRVRTTSDDGASPFVRVRRWAKADDAVPSVAEARTVLTEVPRVKRAADELEVAAVETLKTAVGELMPDVVDNLIRPFVKALAAKLVELALVELRPDDVTDAASAKAFVQRALPGDDNAVPHRSLVALWGLSLPDVLAAESGQGSESGASGGSAGSGTGFTGGFSSTTPGWTGRPSHSLPPTVSMPHGFGSRGVPGGRRFGR